MFPGSKSALVGWRRKEEIGWPENAAEMSNEVRPSEGTKSVGTIFPAVASSIRAWRSGVVIRALRSKPVPPWPVK